jgi:DNA-binding winged helix-turn-helix (wHTH) protein/TolB-like protein/tetratricopeptide (TPR) repeat protein
VAEPGYRFGPFVVDRSRYRVLRGHQVLELTPKLLDLLLHLLDHAGTLVTKEQLLDALWSGANVTDNALSQAVSELRRALGDDAGTPQFIKTVSRRGYRFIAPVERLTASASASAPPAPRQDLSMPADTGLETPPPPATAHAGDTSIAVLDFVNVTGAADSAWLSAGIAETVTGDLRATGRFRVVDRGRVIEAIRRTNGSLREVSADLGASFLVVGSFQRNADRIRITARIVEVESGETLADAKVDGPLAEVFELQDRVVAQFSNELGIASARTSRARASRETASLEAYRSYTEAWLHLESLDVREIPLAIEGFNRAIAMDPRYALAFTGLASAELAAYEATRTDNVPAQHLLQGAVGHARQAVALDDMLAEAHATLGLVLVSAWETDEAVRVARRAVALEATSWRHFFRLCHASWGDERLRAANAALSLYPEFAFAHFQMAMVHVARGDLREAETVLRQGAAVQDRQVAHGDRYPALGLHWLLALVRLAQDDVSEALRELDREQQLADPHRLYGREYEMSALHARGACLLRIDKHAEAARCFSRALELYPDHAQSLIGLALTLRGSGSPEAAEAITAKLPAIVDTLARARPIEAALVESQIEAVNGRPQEAGARLCQLLHAAPRGFAAWTIPIEPFLRELSGIQEFRSALERLAQRAR